jgi:hypothetical protein
MEQEREEAQDGGKIGKMGRKREWRKIGANRKAGKAARQAGKETGKQGEEIRPCRIDK